MNNKNEILGTAANRQPTSSLVKTVTSNLKVNVPVPPTKETTVPIKFENALKPIMMPSVMDTRTPITPSKLVPQSIKTIQSTNAVQPAPVQSSLSSFPVGMPNQMAQSIQQSMPPSAMQANVIKYSEDQIKNLQKELEKTKAQKMSAKSLASLKPVFANIESVLQYQGKAMKKERDYDTPQYNVPLTQSLFNATANQITNMPSWRN